MNRTVLSAMVLFVLLVLCGCGQDYWDAQNLKIGKIDLSTVPDGKYHGVYNGPYKADNAIGFTCTVDVIVSNKAIQSIAIDSNQTSKRVMRAKDAQRKVVEKQSLQIDSVSGASISTKVILKAIEIALTGSK